MSGISTADPESQKHADDANYWQARQIEEMKVQTRWQKRSFISQTLLTIATLILLTFQYCTMRDSVERQTTAIGQTSILIGQQNEALKYARTQAEVAKEALENDKQAGAPIITVSGWDMRPSTFVADDLMTAFVQVSNTGSTEVTGATNYIAIESRSVDPPLNYQPKWIITENVSIQRASDFRTFEASITLSQSQLEPILSRQKSVYVFGYFEFPNLSGKRSRKRYCIKFGPDTKQCATWQNQEDITQ